MSTVNPLFQQYVGRAPTESDQAFYNGQTDRQIVNALLASPEYKRRAAHQAAFPTLGADQVAALTNGGLEARQNLVTQSYQDILGRAPEAEGLAYWSDPARFGAAMQDGSFFNDFLGNGIMSDPNGSNPWDKTAARTVQADQWGDYRQQAEAATAGINRMPGVFSDYGAIPTDTAAKNALFYLSTEDAQKAAASNPLLSGVVTAPTQATQQATADPTAGMHPDDITAMNRSRRMVGLPLLSNPSNGYKA